MSSKIKTFSTLLLLFAIVAFVFFSFSTEPKEKTLFTVTRNFDDDVVKYDLRLDSDGNLDQDDPIHPYWIRHTKGGVKKELNTMQRKFAYGLKYKKIDDGFYRFNFVSYKDLTLYLRESTNGEFNVWVKIDDQYVILKSIFLQVEKNGTIFDLPKLSWVDIKWYAPKSKKSGETRIDPND